MSIKCYTIGECNGFIKEISRVIGVHNIKHVFDIRDGKRSRSYIPLYEFLAKKAGVESYTHIEAESWRDSGVSANAKQIINAIHKGYDFDENVLVIGKNDNALDCIRFSIVGRFLKQLDILILHYVGHGVIKDQTSLEIEMMKQSKRSPLILKECYNDLAILAMKKTKEE